jgi:hypothetical protein
MLAKVISGGQTGVDQAALRAAMVCGLDCGGWCPPGRESESGPIPADLPLVETPRSASAEAPDIPRSLRTEWNVRDSDATLVLRPLSVQVDPGTVWAERHAGLLGRPLLGCDPDDPGAVACIRNWHRGLGVRTLNVAGPSEGAHPGIGELARRVLEEAFARE